MSVARAAWCPTCAKRWAIFELTSDLKCLVCDGPVKDNASAKVAS